MPADRLLRHLCPDVPQTGCQVNTDCPMGQVCNVELQGWGCIPAEPAWDADDGSGDWA